MLHIFFLSIREVVYVGSVGVFIEFKSSNRATAQTKISYEP